MRGQMFGRLAVDDCRAVLDHDRDRRRVLS